MANKPIIRFKGFTDDWEQRKLGDNNVITMGQSPDGSTYSNTPTNFILVQGNADLVNGWVFPRIWTSQITKKCEVGDFIMSVRAPAGTMGKTAFNAVIGRGVAAIKGKEFVFQSLVRMDLNGYWNKYSTGSTFESLNSDAIKNATIQIPSALEQDKIGLMLINLDNLITLHQRNVDNYKQLKQALLQKMFSAEGKTKPIIRFKGFTDDWEQRKLDDVTKSYSGGTPSVGKKEYYNGHIPFIRSAEINSDTTELFLSEVGITNSSAKMVYTGDILYALYGATSGEVGIAQLQGAINQAILAIKPDGGYDSQFLMQWLRGQKQKIVDKYLQGGQGNLSGALVKNLLVKFPNYKEQKQIGNFFCHLDNLITLHQRNVDNLQQLKKALLQKMFI